MLNKQRPLETNDQMTTFSKKGGMAELASQKTTQPGCCPFLAQFHPCPPPTLGVREARDLPRKRVPVTAVQPSLWGEGGTQAIFWLRAYFRADC